MIKLHDNTEPAFKTLDNHNFETITPITDFERSLDSFVNPTEILTNCRNELVAHNLKN